MLVPRGKIAIGKLAQALVHGARLLQVDGSFDDCLELARKLAAEYPVALVNSVNPDRLQGQKTAAFEIVDELGDAPDVHCLPVGNAGNITAYWMGYTEYQRAGLASRTPRMFGFQASGAAPIVTGRPVLQPQTIATAIRIGNPASWLLAEAARDESGGLIDSVTDREILAAYRLLATQEAVFGELASSASVAGLLRVSAAGRIPAGVAGGLHHHRQRPEGPGLGAVRRARPGHHPRRRRRRRHRPGPGLTLCPRPDQPPAGRGQRHRCSIVVAVDGLDARHGAGAGARDQRQPGAGASTRSGSRWACTTTWTHGSVSPGCPSRYRARARTWPGPVRTTWSCGRCGRRSPSPDLSRRALACAA